MARCRVDESIQRTIIDDFAFPLGVYPVEPMSPRQGYTVWFEPADGDDEDDDDTGDAGAQWEEWPDRYVFDIAVTSTRLEALVRQLLALLPPRVFPILDVLGADAYREVDPYVAYDPIGQEHILDALRRYRGYFFEDGLVGFGAMSEDPFLYVFVDEHKMVTVRVQADHKERLEALLAAFDLPPVEKVAGADATVHEHRGVLDAPEGRPDLLTAEEIVEELRDEWGLVLNVDPSGNTDDDGNELGITGWRCIIRFEPPIPEPVEDESQDERSAQPQPAKAGSSPATDTPASGEATPATPAAPAWRYAEILLTADSLADCERMALEMAERMVPAEDRDRTRTDPSAADLPGIPADDRGLAVDAELGRLFMVQADRLTPEELLEAYAAMAEGDESGAHAGNGATGPAASGQASGAGATGVTSGEAAKGKASGPTVQTARVWRARWMG
jgi:hypothetical protein